MFLTARDFRHPPRDADPPYYRDCTDPFHTVDDEDAVAIGHILDWWGEASLMCCSTCWARWASGEAVPDHD
jgi:hypothetical protein